MPANIISPDKWPQRPDALDAFLDELLAGAARNDRELRQRIKFSLEGALTQATRHLDDLDEMATRGAPFCRRLTPEELDRQFPDTGERKRMDALAFALISPAPQGGVSRSYWASWSESLVAALTSERCVLTADAYRLLPSTPDIWRLGRTRVARGPSPEADAAPE